MKKVATLSIVIIVFAVIYFFYAQPSFKIATGYGAKYLGSYTFLSNLPDTIVKKDLNFSIVKYANYEFNESERSMEAKLFGLVAQEAQYHTSGIASGCYLDQDDQDDAPPTGSLKTTHEYTNYDHYWPQGDKLQDTIFSNVNTRKLKEIIERTIDSFPYTRAISIAYKNHLIAENYAPGVNINSRLLGWSMTKTISGTLIGNLEKNGLIKRNDPAGFIQWQKDDRNQITVNNLLQMCSGLKWTEDYTKISEVTRMLYLEPDFASYAISRPQNYAAGDFWYYASGTTNILSQIIRSKFNSQKDYLSFPKDSLFNIIGMNSALIETDNSGNFVFSSYGWATARDWTRFGLLYLNKGNWFGHQVFTPEWFKYSTTPAPASDGQYGVQLWLNASKKQLPSAPADAFFEKGYGGQRVVIIPSMDLVVVLLSGRQQGFDFDTFLSEVLDCFE
ncbi:MAG: serine hydrolase [Bacteroidales bacterium]|nr:serine hydrolase [Bacteroidales bacterium]